MKTLLSRLQNSHFFSAGSLTKAQSAESVGSVDGRRLCIQRIHSDQGAKLIAEMSKIA